MTSSGASTGTSAGEVMTPLGQDGIFLPAPDPTVLSATRGESGAEHTSAGTGLSSLRSCGAWKLANEQHDARRDARLIYGAQRHDRADARRL